MHVLSDNPSNANPCLSCGACCAHFRVSFYSGELKGPTGGLVPAELTTQIGPLRACMKGTELGQGRCIALRGELGKPGVHCTIYENRPSPCREFNVLDDQGMMNPDCLRLRYQLGLAMPFLKNQS
ncbi:YkgJ family cysteine cluster protein [Paenalcaligenes hominis]|uniref:YkgJ family cysteine cluster protein n=1 Tax=Paenalcaligenes hominis TaxID=643674 RepID=UPI003526667B